VSGYCNINNTDLQVAGATVCGDPRCPNIAILIIQTCELWVRLAVDTLGVQIL
jgi:hypothetical protein